MKKFISVIFLAFACTAVPAAMYYVDFDKGNDANSGTSPSSAWLTLPGTMTVDGTAYLHSRWGSFNTSGNIPDNTVFRIKAGTTHRAAHGGYVLIYEFYRGGSTNITFRSDSSWGVGDHATFDFVGMTNSRAGMFMIRIGGTKLINLNFLNAPWDAVYCKEFGNGAPTANLYLANCNFTNNGVGFTDMETGASEGELNIRYANNVVITNCIFDSTNAINGVMFADYHKQVTNALVIACQSYNHRGDPVNHDDVGIGFKALYSQVTYSNCVSANNQKGFDLGSHGDGLYFGYVVINCTASNNYGYGINMVGQGGASQGPYPYPTNSYNYQINNVIVSNGVAGSRIYGSCQYLHLIHNYYAYNGWADPRGEGTQININPDDYDGKGPLVAHVYNNLFVKALGRYVYVDRSNSDTNIFTLDMDYNSYVQRGTEQFAVWDLYGQGHYTAVFGFGANGPGRASGNWSAWYRNSSVVPPRGGTGHGHADAHSKGTGAVDPTLPPLDFTLHLTNSYPGSVLSTQSWYVAGLMARDRSGNLRSSWDLGPYEYAALPK